MTLHTQSTAPAAVPNGAGRRSAAQSRPGAVNRSSVGAAKSDDAASRSAATPGGVTGRGAATSSDVPSRCAAPSGSGALWRAAGVASPVAAKSSDADYTVMAYTVMEHWPYIVLAYIVMALYSYGPIYLWPYIAMALYGYGPT